MTDDSISINILTDNQKLPARPLDFKSGLASEEKKIGNPRLCNVLASVMQTAYPDPQRKELFLIQGEDLSLQSDSNNETRGRKSYYDISRVKQIIDQSS